LAGAQADLKVGTNRIGRFEGRHYRIRGRPEGSALLGSPYL